MWMGLALVVIGLAAEPDSDEQACEEAQRQATFDAWMRYLKRYPAGDCAALPKAIDAKACRYARAENNTYQWKDYLKRHPKGLCIATAKGVLEDGIPFVQNIGIQRPTVLGKMDPQPVLEAISFAGEGLQACWERSGDPNLFGDLTIRFQIKKDGTVKGARAQDSTLNNKAMDSCLAAAVGTVTFDKVKPDSTVLVTLPLKVYPKR